MHYSIIYYLFPHSLKISGNIIYMQVLIFELQTTINIWQSLFNITICFVFYLIRILNIAQWSKTLF